MPAPVAVARTVSGAPAPAVTRTEATLDMTFVLLGALGLGAALMAFSATPEAVLMRGALGSTVVRARVEIGLLGAGIVTSVCATYLVVASS